MRLSAYGSRFLPMSDEIHVAPSTLDTSWQATQFKRMAAAIAAKAPLHTRLTSSLRALYARRNGDIASGILERANAAHKQPEDSWAELPDHCLHRTDKFAAVGEISDS